MTKGKNIYIILFSESRNSVAFFTVEIVTYYLPLSIMQKYEKLEKIGEGFIDIKF